MNVEGLSVRDQLLPIKGKVEEEMFSVVLLLLAEFSVCKPDSTVVKAFNKIVIEYIFIFTFPNI